MELPSRWYQFALASEILADDVAGFARLIGGRSPRIPIFLVATPAAPAWKLVDAVFLFAFDFVVASGAAGIARMMLGFF